MRSFFRKIATTVYEKIFKVNDTPHKIALGLGLGIFSGVLPGTGILAALFLAFIFRANRATALFGCLLTNTWISFIILILAIKAGALIFGVKWQLLHETWIVFLKGFNWNLLLKASTFKIILPIIVGYLTISFIVGIAVYLITLTALHIARRTTKNNLA